MATSRAFARLLCAAFTLLCVPSHAQFGFSVTFDASANQLTQNERDVLIIHLYESGAYWYRALGQTAPRDIRLRVAIGNNPTANAGSSTAVDIGTINGRTTYQQGIGAELRSGIDPNGTDVDGTMTIGLNYLRNTLWFDPNPQLRTALIPENRVDAFSVLAHEWGHMIAYNGWANGAGVPPVDYWSTWDRWMQPGTPTVIVGPQSVLTWGTPPDITTNNIAHWGNAAFANGHTTTATRAVVWHNGAPVPWTACEFPAVIAPPAGPFSIAGNTLADELMNGVVYHYQRRYYISALDIAVLADVGLLIDEIFKGGFQ
jgi:hypothetical protein